LLTRHGGESLRNPNAAANRFVVYFLQNVASGHRVAFEMLVSYEGLLKIRTVS
jgi:hypothetical protein